MSCTHAAHFLTVHLRPIFSTLFHAVSLSVVVVLLRPFSFPAFVPFADFQWSGHLVISPKLTCEVIHPYYNHHHRPQLFPKLRRVCPRDLDSTAKCHLHLPAPPINRCHLSMSCWFVSHTTRQSVCDLFQR